MRTATSPCSDENRTAVYLTDDDRLARLILGIPTVEYTPQRNRSKVSRCQEDVGCQCEEARGVRVEGGGDFLAFRQGSSLACWLGAKTGASTVAAAAAVYAAKEICLWCFTVMSGRDPKMLDAGAQKGFAPSGPTYRSHQQRDCRLGTPRAPAQFHPTSQTPEKRSQRARRFRTCQ